MSRQGEARARTVDNVIEFWNGEAREWGNSPQVTIRDHYFRLLETQAVCEIIRGKFKVLDIGCGTGFSTLFYAQHVESIIGADGASEMVAQARRFLDEPAYFALTMERYARGERPQLRGNIRFEPGNILSLTYPDASFDAVIAERVLINLPARRLQDEAVQEVARVLQPGGVWALVEVTEQGHSRVDEFRSRFGLGILEKYWHNLYVDESRLAQTVRQAGLAVLDVRCFETYQFLTKVVHPLVVRPQEPCFLSNFNYAALVISQEFPTYESVRGIGLARFLTEIFAGVLAQHAAEFLPQYDRTIPDVLHADPNFTGCSHQVLYVLGKSK